MPNGETTIHYNNPILFPADFDVQLHNSRYLADEQEISNQTKPMIEIVSVDRNDTEENLISLLGWNITSFDSQEIVFKVFYEHPLEVS